MLKVYVLLRAFIVLTQHSWVVVRNLTDCLLLSDLPRSWVKIKSKTEYVAAQQSTIQPHFCVKTQRKPYVLLLSELPQRTLV
jgi:hypothetical protein